MPNTPQDGMALRAIRSASHLRDSLESRVETMRQQLEEARSAFQHRAVENEFAPPSPPAAPFTDAPNNAPWLVIGVPTVPRPGEPLSRTLQSILRQLPTDPSHLLHGRVRVVVMNQRPGAHPGFERIEATLQSPHPGSVHAPASPRTQR